jgi:hypothetical protein
MTWSLGKAASLTLTCAVLAAGPLVDAAKPAFRAGPDSIATHTHRPRVDPRLRRPPARSRKAARPAGTPVRTVGVTVTVVPATSVLALELDQNAPNPVDVETSIRYAVPTSARVRLQVFDILGKQVAELVNQTQDPGRYVVRWNRTDGRGHLIHAGVYVYRLLADYGAGGHGNGQWRLDNADAGGLTRKMVLR